MAKTSVLNVRIDPKIREEAEKILQHLGMTNSQAITMFYRMIALKRGLPFEVRITETDETAYIKSHPEWVKEIETSMNTHKSGSGKEAPSEVMDEIDRV